MDNRLIRLVMIELMRYEAYEEFLSLIDTAQLQYLYDRLVEINEQRRNQQKEFRDKYGVDGGI